MDNTNSSVQNMYNQVSDPTKVAAPSSGQSGSSSWVSNLLGSVPGLISGFNYRAQENNIALANAQAQAMQGQNSPGSPKNFLWIIVAIVVAIVLLILFTKSKTA